MCSSDLIKRQDCKTHKCKGECPLGTLRTISESQDEAHYDHPDVEVFQDKVCNVNSFETKGGVLHGVCQNNEGDVVVSLGVGFISQDRRKSRGVRITRANQEKIRLKTW